MNSFKNISKELIKELKNDRIQYISNYLSYNFLMAVFPLIFFLMTLFGVLKLDNNIMHDTLSGVFPKIIYDFADEITTQSNFGLLALSFFISIYSASNGASAAMTCFNSFYDIRQSGGFLKAKGKSLMIVLLLAIAVFCSFLINILGNTVENSLTAHFGDSALVSVVFGFFGKVASWLIAGIVILLVYKVGIYRKTKIISLLPGAVLTLAVWMISSFLFGVYVEHFSNFQVIYGSIAAIIILLLWLNILSSSLLIGAELNAILFKTGAC